MSLNGVLAKATLAAVMIGTYCTTTAHAAPEKISYKSCLEKIKAAKALKGDGLLAVMAHKAIADSFAPLEATIYVAKFQEGPKIGEARTAMVVVFESDHNFIMRFNCSPSGSFKDMGDGKKIIAARTKIKKKELTAKNARRKAELEEKRAQLAKEKTAEKAGKEKLSFADEVARALSSSRSSSGSGTLDPSRPMTTGEIDAVRHQIAKCWNLDPGARETEELVVEIVVNMNPDRTVRDARIINQARMTSNPFYRTAAESAFRAVLNPRCQPFPLPPEKYIQWQTMTLSFNPKEMFGL